METLPIDLEAVVHDVWPGAGAIHATPVEGGITNRNFRVEVDGEPFFVRLFGAGSEDLGIDRDGEWAAARAAAGAGLAPDVVAYLPRRSALVTRFIDAPGIPVERMRDPDVLPLAVAGIRTIHGLGTIPSSFDAFEIHRRYRETAAAHGVDLPSAYRPLAAFAENVRAAFARHPFPSTPCHNDLLNGNFLLDGDRVRIVDYEYAGMGDPFFDLGNFSVNHGFDDEDDERLLAEYFGEATPARRARLGLMKVMSDLREAMWGVVQQGISTLDFDYVDYATRHFERCAAKAADPRVPGWLADAEGPA